MKKILTYSAVAALVAILFTSCVKETVIVDHGPDWLSQERGEVVYSSNYCGFYVVETNYGYTIIQNLDGLRTYDGDLLYGNFGAYGSRDFYNYTVDLVTGGNVLEYDLTYYEAMDAIDYYCPVGKSNGLKIRQTATSQNKIPRTNTPVKP
ncbi:MAG: hypothetical protein ABIN36_17435 [Ferruginibacter sp.]